jgi:UDP-3-O-[3-hydroxymyristoyl] glucosamine N-acyltransferase
MLGNGVTVHLTGGAVAKNVFWQVAGSVDLGTTSHFEGIVLCQTMINVRTGASITGRLMAHTAVTLDSSTVAQPTP